MSIRLELGGHHIIPPTSGVVPHACAVRLQVLCRSWQAVRAPDCQGEEEGLTCMLRSHKASSKPELVISTYVQYISMQYLGTPARPSHIGMGIESQGRCYAMRVGGGCRQALPAQQNISASQKVAETTSVSLGARRNRIRLLLVLSPGTRRFLNSWSSLPRARTWCTFVAAPTSRFRHGFNPTCDTCFRQNHSQNGKGGGAGF